MSPYQETSDTKTPLVSVIMGVYNGETYLREAIDSILSQSFTDFEFIIVDDGSSDNTWSILSTYSEQDQRIVLVRNEENRGLVFSLNRGLDLAYGQYIARQDADDLSLPTRFAEQVAFLEANPKVGVLATQVVYISSDGRYLGESNLPTDNSSLQERLLTANCLSHGSVLMRSHLVRSIGKYRCLAPAEDYDLWLRLAEVTQIANLPTALYIRRFHLQSVSYQHWYKQASYAKLVRLLANQRREYNTDSVAENVKITLPEPDSGHIVEICLRYATLASRTENWQLAKNNLEDAAKFGLVQEDWLSWALDNVSWFDREFSQERVIAVISGICSHTPATLGTSDYLRPILQGAWWTRKCLSEALDLYMSGDEESAKVCFSSVLAIGGVSKVDEPYLFDWLLKHAQTLSNQAQSYKAGERFIQTILSNLDSNRFWEIKTKSLGTFHIRAAFENHSQGDFDKVRHHLIAAVRNDRHWLRNRGVISIGLNSLIGWPMIKLSQRLLKKISHFKPRS